MRVCDVCIIEFNVPLDTVQVISTTLRQHDTNAHRPRTFDTPTYALRYNTKQTAFCMVMNGDILALKFILVLAFISFISNHILPARRIAQRGT